MTVIWGAILIIVSAIGWLGQVVTALWPRAAMKLDLTEAEADVDAAFYADVRGEAYWDAVILWTLPVAGILLLVKSPGWAYLGLVGGGMWLYLAGRGIATRLVMQRRAIHIGKAQTLNLYYAFLALWGLIAVVTIAMAVAALPLP